MLFGSFVEKSLPGGRIGEMRGFLKEHSGVFGPDEVHILVAAFDKAWETVTATALRNPQAETENEYSDHNEARARPGPSARRRSTRLGSIKSAERVCEPTQPAERRSIAYQSSRDCLRISLSSFGPLISLRLRSWRSSSVADGSL